MSRSRLQIILPILVVLAGVGVTALLVVSRKQPERVERPAIGPLVEVEQVQAGTVTVEVRGNGEVSPRVAVELAPQVTGRVVEVHPAMVSGGRFRAGATLLRIDPRDYQLAVEQAKAAVASAQTALEREQAESEVARAEWQEMRGGEEPPPLVARKPQIREAEARLAAAQADLAQAQLGLDRTRLSLPFDGMVAEESVDLGQLVTAGQRVATIYGTAAVEIRVPLPDRELAWLDLPGEGGAGKTPGKTGPVTARVEANFAGAPHTWRGRIDRLEGQVDERSRMVHVVVVVDDPWGVKTAGGPPLLPGTFVEVVLEGKRLEDVVTVPRHALHAGDEVWVVDGGVLHVRPVEVLRSDRERALIGQGLEGGEQVVVSSLDAVTDGMAVRTEESSPGAGAPEEEDPEMTQEEVARG